MAGRLTRRAFNLTLMSILSLFLVNFHLDAQAEAHQAPFSAIVDPATLLPANGGDGSMGVVLNGATSGDNLGASIAMDQDVNGDGRSDLLVGAPQVGFGNGQALLVFGSANVPMGPDGLETAAIVNGSIDPAVAASFSFPRRSSFFGRRVRFLGDLDGDGIADLGIHASTIDLQAVEFLGETYILYGGSGVGNLVRDVTRLLPENGGNGQEGFVFVGEVDDDLFGADFFGGHHINGDGHTDLLISSGKEYEPGRGSGHIFVIYGQAGRPFAAAIGFEDLLNMPAQRGFLIVPPVPEQPINVLFSDIANSRFINDINGDSLDEIMFCRRLSQFPQTLSNGECYIIFGRAGVAPFPSLFDTGRLLSRNGGDGTEGMVVIGSAPLEGLGSTSVAVDGVGDFDHDGHHDLLIGADSSGGGPAYLFFGQDEFPAELDLRKLNNPGAQAPRIMQFLPVTDESSNTGFGFSVAGFGDINQDGLADIAIHNVELSQSVSDINGTWVIYGRADPPAEFNVADLLPVNGGDGSRGFLVRDLPDEESLGRTISAGDFNGDGLIDMAFGGLAMDPGNRSNAGRVVVLFGRGLALPGPIAVPVVGIWALLLLVLMLLIASWRRLSAAA